jgi:hypothetical protein
MLLTLTKFYLFSAAGPGSAFVFFSILISGESKSKHRQARKRKISSPIYKPPTPNINPTITRLTSTLISKSSPNKNSPSASESETHKLFPNLTAWRGSKCREAPLEKSKQTPHCKVLAPPGPRQQHKRLRSRLSLLKTSKPFLVPIFQPSGFESGSSPVASLLQREVLYCMRFQYVKTQVRRQ